MPPLTEMLLLQKANESGSPSPGGDSSGDSEQSEELKKLVDTASRGWSPRKVDMEARTVKGKKATVAGKEARGLFMSHFAYNLKSSGLEKLYKNMDWPQFILDLLMAQQGITGWNNIPVNIQLISVARTQSGLIGVNIVSIDQLMPLPPGYAFDADDAKQVFNDENRVFGIEASQEDVDRELYRNATSFQPSKTCFSCLFQEDHHPFSQKFFYPRTENRLAALRKHFLLDGAYPPTVWYFHEENAPTVERSNLYTYNPPKTKIPFPTVPAGASEKEVYQAGFESMAPYRSPPNNLSYPPELVVPVFKPVTATYGCPDSKFLGTVTYVKPLYGVTLPLCTSPGVGSIPNLAKKTVELLNNPLHFKTRWLNSK